MAFLNNSGDIILDAVITDLGRDRLAKGNFKITKFALGDDEIDYSLFDRTAATANRDLQILQTPVLEAFTNNASSMKSKLLTINKRELLYLPVLKINNLVGGSEFSEVLVSNGFVVSVDSATEADFAGTALTRFIRGSTALNKKIIRIDQGIDNRNETALDPDLKETQYIIELDSRFASIVGGDGTTVKTPDYIDDDYIASYFLSQTTDTESVMDNRVSHTDVNSGQTDQVIDGPRGTSLKFSLQSSADLQSSNYLFDALGSSDSATISGLNIKKIITNIIVTGVSTGYSVTIPVVFAKSV